MSMNGKSGFTSIGLLLLAASVTQAQKLPEPGGKPGVTVVPAATAAAQIERGRALSEKFYRAQSDQEREAAFAEAWANLAILARVWPTDTSALLEGALIRADLASNWGLHQNIVEVLVPVAEYAKGTPREPDVELRLGQAYERLGNARDAEVHLTAAERSLPSIHACPIRTPSTMQASGSRVSGRRASSPTRPITTRPGKNLMP
jgi:hypothetical protein